MKIGLAGMTFVILLFLGCALQPRNGEAAAIHPKYLSSKPKIYTVQKGDTLYSVAWRYGLDTRNLARWNHLGPTGRVRIGQRLQTTPEVVEGRQTLSKKGKLAAATSKSKVKKANLHWRWPVKGRIAESFSQTNKGINITGRLGEPVMTTAEGVVVYAGTGLRAYGKLLIIKHNSEFLSAYAYNEQLLVKDGQRVKPGQIVARMGKTGTSRVMLHFEIRRAGKPVDPLKYLG